MEGWGRSSPPLSPAHFLSQEVDVVLGPPCIAGVLGGDPPLAGRETPQSVLLPPAWARAGRASHLAGVLRLVLVDEVHEEEPVRGGWEEGSGELRSVWQPLQPHNDPARLSGSHRHCATRGGSRPRPGRLRGPQADLGGPSGQQWPRLPYSHVVRQVVLLQGVGVEAVGRRVKIVTADSTDEAFGLGGEERP